MNRMLFLIASVAIALALGGCHHDYNDTGDTHANPSSSSATSPTDNGMPPARSSTAGRAYGQPGSASTANQPASASTSSAQKPST